MHNVDTPQSQDLEQRVLQYLSAGCRPRIFAPVPCSLINDVALHRLFLLIGHVFLRPASLANILSADGRPPQEQPQQPQSEDGSAPLAEPLQCSRGNSYQPNRRKRINKHGLEKRSVESVLGATSAGVRAWWNWVKAVYAFTQRDGFAAY